jgi:hypothetical protein
MHERPNDAVEKVVEVPCQAIFWDSKTILREIVQYSAIVRVGFRSRREQFSKKRFFYSLNV